MLKMMRRTAVLIALAAILPCSQGVRAANYAFLDIDFENSSEDLWGFETSGSGFAAEATILDGSGAIRFGGGNGTGSPGKAQLKIPYERYGDLFEVEFDLYHPLADAGDTFIRLTDESDKDVFSLYLRESGDSADIAGKTMRYGLNTVLGSNSLGDNAKGSAKLLSTPETGNAGPNGITYHIHSFIDLDAREQSLIITEKESGKEVVRVEDADIKNASEPAWLKIGYGYVVSEYEGVYIDNLRVSAQIDEDIYINSFDISEGKASAEIENVSGNDIDAMLAYAVYKPDGRILMIYKGVQDTTGGDTSKPNGVVKIGATIAESPMGPYEKQDGLLFEGSGTLAAEDPFVWYSSEDEKYYAVVRDAVGGFTGTKGALTLFESSDGVTDWHASKNPLVLPNYITWEDGTRNNSQVERPWLMFDENGTPIMLFGATRINNSENFTTNVFIPLLDQ